MPAVPSRATAAILLACLPLLVQLPLLTPWLSADPLLWTSNLVFPPPGHGYPVIGFPGWVDGNAGVTTEALGRLAATDWLRGRVPWWNPYSGVGLPLAAEMQSSALFLPFVLLLALKNGVLLLKIAMQSVAGLASFALLRTLRVAAPVALTVAVLAEFDGTFAWFAHAPIMPVAFLPLLLLGIERCHLRARAGRNGGWAIIAVAIAGSVYAGFPETAFLDGLLALVFAAARLSASPPGAPRRRFVRSVVEGGLCGLLLCAPASVPFLDFLRRAYLSVHADESAATLLAGNYAQLLFPYAYGAIQFGNLVTGSGENIWWHSGGYVGLPALFLAAFSVLQRGGRDRPLRLALAGWIAVTFLKAAGFAPAVALLDVIPFVRRIFFPVYIVPSWIFATLLLSALALDDLAAGRIAARARPLAASLGATFAIAGAATWLGRTEIARLWRYAPGYEAVAVPASCLTVLTVLLAATLIGRRTPVRLAALCTLLCLDAGSDFALPLLSASRPRPLDEGVVAFLRQHLGLQRFYAVSVFAPNYGAYERLASVNHNYLPVPQRWVDFLRDHLSREMDGVNFFGTAIRPIGFDPVGEQVDPTVTNRAALHTLAGLAVRYLVVPHGFDPLVEEAGTPVALTGNTPLALAPTATLAVTAPGGGALSASRLEAVGVDIGTYDGAADGTLMLRVCAAAACRTGHAALRGAPDDQVLWVTLPAPLAVGPADPVTVTLSRQGGARPVAIWLFPIRAGSHAVAAATATADPSARGRLPLLMFGFRPDTPPLARAYTDPFVDILDLPGAAPYANDATGRCRLATLTRTTIAADCSTPGTLLRRELFDPGWRATVDGRPVPVAAAGELFQSVALPAGRSVVRFGYRPPWSRTAAVLMLGGLCWLAWSSRGRGRPGALPLDPAKGGRP